ncbi:hypothetical protein EsVE80_19700 [Enterococcus saigonensis]|uniref:DUF2877 domain-containing protein n=1 Tax=Enterococcus saigonensis TaxID=1805431 RepID=A0A679ISI8_9ENTE|nr:DUF2877 domain-containing protein [Enterococcus saigonensis]BCA86447.1 hypothetical protein EsVE80_19700 [Enterococcus saigonensis]
MLTKIVISDYLLPLKKFGVIGSVHSVFEHSFNLKVGEELINVANYYEYLSCFGLFVPTEMFAALKPYVKQGDRIKITNDRIVFYNQMQVKTLPLIDYTSVSLKVSATHLEKEPLQFLQQLLVAADLEEKIGINKDMEFTAVKKQLLKPQQANWARVTKFLVGRGQGLTPSGDDILVAYTFVAGAFKKDYATGLVSELAKQKGRTTDISFAYIKSCEKGYVNSLIYQLYQDLKKNRKENLAQDIQNIMAIGHTSGKDMCYGIYLGISAILNT